MIRSWAVNPRRTIGAIVISAFVATMALGDAFGAETGSVPSSADASAAGSISPDIPIRERVGLATETDRYVRAAIGAERALATRFMDKDCANDGGEFVPLYGCGTGFDGKPFSSSGNFDTMRSFELAAGYIAAPFLRIEALVQRRAAFSFKGLANFSQLDRNSRRDVHVDASAVSVMFATYVDLPELGVPGIGALSPFVGAGVGHSRIKTSETRQEFRCTTTILPGGRNTNFAWMAAVGVSAPVSDRVTLDMSLRHTDLGQVETGRGDGGVYWRSNTPGCTARQAIPLKLSESRAELVSRGLWISLRYAF